MDLKWLAANRQVQALLDIGANDGSFAEYLKRTFGPEEVHVFEPLPQHTRTLQERGFITHPFALSDHDGYASFNISESDTASSLRSISSTCEKEFPQTQRVDTITVETRRLDGLLAPIEGALIKIDAQGQEREIIEGGVGVIGAASLVLIEQTFQPLYEGQALFNEIHRLLDTLGLDLIGIRSQTTAQDGTPLFAHAIYERRTVEA